MCVYIYIYIYIYIICYKFMFNMFMYNHMFMCSDMFVKLIKILKQLNVCWCFYFVMLLSLNFMSISSSLVIFDKVPHLAFNGLFSSLVGHDPTSSMSHIFCGSRFTSILIEIFGFWSTPIWIFVISSIPCLKDRAEPWNFYYR